MQIANLHQHAVVLVQIANLHACGSAGADLQSAPITKSPQTVPCYALLANSLALARSSGIPLGFFPPALA